MKYQRRALTFNTMAGFVKYEDCYVFILLESFCDANLSIILLLKGGTLKIVANTDTNNFEDF